MLNGDETSDDGPKIAPDEERVPKLFISYSWTSDAHVDWVMQLATDLREHGVEAIIDQWHLKEGHDAHSFMEQMVRDESISKVVLVCDDKYVSRANERKGGVGVESQIITKNIYGDVGQTKFVALTLASEDNGDALLPNFLQARIYIDFRNSDEYAQNLRKLLRWAFDKPWHILPKLGSRPDFLDEKSEFHPIRLPAVDPRINSQRKNDPSFLSFWEEAKNNHSDFTIDLIKSETPDELVFQAIQGLPPLISQMIVQLRDCAGKRELDVVETDALIFFFEEVLSHYDDGGTSWGGDVTKYFGAFVFVAVVAILLRYRRFQSVERLLSSPMLNMKYDGVTAHTVSISKINSHLRSLDYRNQRLGTNRVSLHADAIREMCSKVPIADWEYFQAEFYLFLYFDRMTTNGRWWPVSNIYAADRDGSYPLFARATQVELRNGLLSPLGLAKKTDIEALQAEIREGKYQEMRWSSAFSTLSIWSLGNFGEILNSFGD